MSYILNALRKSERERQAIEPESVTARIVAHQTPRHQSSTRLIAALIAINLAVLVYFLGFNEKTPSGKTPSAVAPSMADVVESEEAGRAEPDPASRPLARPAEAKPPVIAKIVAARSEAAASPTPGRPTVVKKQPVEPVKPVPEPQQPVVQAIKPATPPAVKSEAVKKQPDPIKPAVEQPQPVIQQTEPAKVVQKTQPASVPAPIIETAPAAKPVQAKSDLPFLDELPAEFARSLPELPINVFSYSSTPGERFVMIDMVKYTPGQRIKDQLELKEIRADSIVVNYDGRTFKIKRP